MSQELIEGFRLSPQQQRLWTAQAGGRAFMAQCAVDIKGPLDSASLREALREVVARHEALRTTFQQLPGMNVTLQVISDEAALSLREVDLGGVARGERAAHVGRLLREEGAQPFSFERGPLGRFALLRLDAGEHVLLVTLPAMCADARTLRNLVAECSRAYGAARVDEEAEESLQYVQFSEWQHELLTAEGAEAGREFWSAQRVGERPDLSLPLDAFARGGARADLGAGGPETLTLTLEPETADWLYATAERYGASVNVLLLACWQALLRRLTWQPEVVVRALFDGREFEELQEAMGLFAKYLPVTARFREDLRFHELLEATGRSVQETYSWQGHFAEESEGATTASVADATRLPVAFEFEEWPEEFAGGKVRFSLLRQFVWTEEFRLKLSCLRTGRSLSAEIYYDPKLYAADAVRQLRDEFETLLTHVLEDPEARISRMEILSDGRKRMLLEEWNETRAEFRSGEVVHKLFEEQAARTPHRMAVVYEGQRLSFDELNRRANQVAHYLRRLGVGPEARVCLLMERSPEMLVGLLGILKAGAAYVPLDAGQPGQRLQFMLEDSRPAALLSQRSPAAGLMADRARVLLIDSDWPDIARESEADPGVEMSSENLAYVIYTSGSTGRPKGTMISHRAVVNLSAALRASVYARADAPLRISLNAPLAFDASVKQIIQLLAGHTLYIVPEETRRDGEALLRFVERNELNVLDCTPSHLKLLLAAGLAEGHSPDMVLVGGEAWDPSDWVRLAEHPGTQFYNVYGPTECTVNTTACALRGAPARPTIGRPLANVRTYILDPRLQPVPVGVAGELYIGGAGVARGYLNQPRLTAERFIPDPFGGEPGARLYRSGDFARYMPDGNIDFLGRADNQVKVRGFRIELGEIEAVIVRNPSVREAVVLAREDEPGDKRLVAYVVPTGVGHAAAHPSGAAADYPLPNGMTIAHQNKNETDYLYEEIFQKRTYVRHGVELEDGCCVFDVGANIGMFSLFVNQECRGASIYAFEPLAPIYEKLKVNAGLYGSNVRLFNIGISDAEKVETFTYYPRYSMMSGTSAYADPAGEVEVIKRFLSNEGRGGDADVADLLEHADELLEGRFANEVHECRLRTLSSVISENKVERIDLLKIDVQRAEMDVLRGISDEDWRKIRQVVMEVHDAQGAPSEGRTKETGDLLRGKGFDVVVEQDELLKGTDRYNLYAVNSEKKASAGGQARDLEGRYVVQFAQPEFTVAGLRAYLEERLPDYMIPQAFVMLDELLVTRNGKVDRAALPPPGVAGPAAGEEYVAPQTETEKLLADIWCEVLGLERVSIHDSFFHLGGDSIRSIKLRVLAQKNGLDFSLQDIFTHQTVHDLAQQIVAYKADEESRQRTQPFALISEEDRSKLPEDIEDAYPLSMLQLGMLFHSEYTPESPMYYNANTLHLKAHLDAEKMRAAIAQLMARHPALRTSFDLTNFSRPLQLVHREARVPLVVEDLSHLPAAEQQEIVDGIVESERTTKFNWTVAPLIRFKVHRRSDETFQLTWCEHHSILDGWSLAALTSELFENYFALVAGAERQPAPPPAVDYAQFIALEQQSLNSAEDRGYWLQKLSDSTNSQLPDWSTETQGEAHRTRLHMTAIPQEVSQGLKEFAQAAGVTLKSTLLAAHVKVMGLLSGQADVVTGLVSNGRPEEADAELVLGLFLNTLPFRMELDGSSWVDLARSAFEAERELMPHRRYPMAQLQKELGGQPLFETMFNFIHFHVLDKLKVLEGVQLLEWESAVVDINLALATNFELDPVSSSVQLNFQYDARRISAERIKAVGDYYVNALKAMTSDPHGRHDSVSLLPAAEVRQLLEEFNDTVTDFDLSAPLHRLFEAQVSRTPDATALTFRNRSLTYGELNERANQLAHLLAEAGVGPELLVAVFLSRSVEMVVALLAVLKAGAAYVPLDPEYPQQRLSFMLSDAEPPVLLTDEQHKPLLPQTPTRVICLDSEWPQIAARYGRSNPETPVNPGNLAYVIYTSGSTGRPKAAMNEHRAACNRLLWMQQAMPLSCSDVVLQKTPYSFDVSVWEFFWPLIYGARLALAEPGGHRDPAYLRRVIEGEGVTIIHFVPSMLAAFLSGGGLAGGCRGLRRVVCSGEALPDELRRRFFEQAPAGARLYNLYGPTEAAVDVTWWECERGGERRAVPIGAPIANARLYVLDAGMGLAPRGARGELYIGGVAVGRGYLGRAGLTAERFVPDPYAGEAGARMYRTGDLARWGEGGALEYLGRADFQVKVRGQRVELGEVESALRGQAGVREAAAAVRAGASGDPRLVAFITRDGGGDSKGERITTAEMRERLRESLPDYMIPAVLVELKEMPLTQSGKIDRRALPEEGATRPDLRQEYVGAETETEKTLCEIWARALGVDRVGIHDNFFDLGGDSILSIQVISRARQAGILLTPRHLFQHQTVARLAAAAQHTTRSAEGDESEQSPVTGPLPLTPVQHWFFEQNLPNPHHWNQALLLETRQPLDVSLLERALQELLSHHDALRLRFTREDSGWCQFNADASERASCVALNISALPPEEQRGAIVAQATALQSNLDISRGPLCRAAYFHTGAESPGRLLLVIHHLAVDAVSWRILLEDLETSYLQLSRGERARLLPKTVSYKEWAERLVKYAGSPEAEREAAYWLGEREGVCARLPVDSPGGDHTEASAQTVSVSLNEEETRSLLHEVPAAYHARINEVLLYALAQTLPRWAGGEVPVDLEAHGRDGVFGGLDTSGTVGWFTSIFPVTLLATGSKKPSWQSVLRGVKERFRRVPNGGIGYGVLRYLRADAALRERLRGVPQPEVSFNYLGQLDQVFSGSRLFEQAGQETGPTHDPLSPRRYLLEINGRVSEGRLRLDWSYNESLHLRATIENLAHEFTEALRSLIAACAEGGADFYTASDFLLANLDQAALDRLVSEHGRFTEVYTLSPIQRGMLFHSVYEPASGVYVEQLSLTFRGDLDAAAFEQAWRKVMQRHATLRTAFIWENLDEPLQLVRPRVALPWRYDDWRLLSADEQRGRLANYLRADRERGFALSEAPLMRLWLVRLTDQTWQLVWSFHHLLLDGWSLPIVLGEVLAFYEAAREGRELKPETGRPYLDYVEWISRQDLSEAEAFWRGYLKGFHAPTPLVVDDVARQQSDEDGGRAEDQTRLSPSETARLQAFARRQRLTLNTLLQGTWALVLSRYSGEPEVVFGATVSGRSAELAGVEGMVGPFINTVPVRVRTPPEAIASEWLKALQEQQAGLRNFEYTPLVQIQGWSEIPRGLPMFESIFVLENYPVDASLRDQSGSLKIDGVDFFEQTNYPLTIIAVPGEELLLKVMYDSRRLDAASVSRMLLHFENLLAGIVADPARPIARLPLLSSDELTRLLKGWNDTHALYPRAKCLHQLFEEQAGRTPQSTALVFGETRLSYAELNERSDRLARHLQSLGVGPESLVAILLERSVEMVVALLAVLKAGAAYVPADLAYPRERLKFMLEDAQVAALLTDSRLTHVLPESEVTVICLDQLPGESSGAGDTFRPAAPVSEDNLAYVIYTSGSTGRPKGVAITHRSAVMLLHWSQQTWSKTELSGVLASTSICFDLSVFELFLPLSVGGQIILAENALQLPSLAAADEVTLVNTVPSAMTELVRSGALPPSVRVVNMAGEPLKQPLVEQVYEQRGVERVFNLYGPSEDTTYSTFALMERGRSGAPSIGRPVANTQAYLLDANLEPVPQGVVGELYLGGEGLARGYLNRADLTAEKFIPDPFATEPGARLYGTGDLARHLPGGELEFLGRVDHQVKVRGFRIELGEVEARLVEQPGVREAVVVAREEAGGEQRLVGYVACAKDEAPPQSELRKRLKECLPEYMVPQTFVLMEKLPLTPNGKIDRKALPAPGGLRPELSEDLVAPRTPLEGALADIWKSVLGLEDVSIHDNFFDLGGHSLLAMQMLTRVRSVLGVDLPLKDLMSAPTVAESARLLEARGAAAVEAVRLASAGNGRHAGGVIPRRRAGDEAPLSFAQQRLWFLSQLRPDAALYNCPAAVRLSGRLNAEALARALDEIVRRHEILRTNFPADEDGNPIQRILPACPLDARVVDLRVLPADEREDEARHLMLEEARRPFDLTRDRLLRVTLMNIAEEESVLMLTAHHINVDAWSMGVLVKELAVLYEAFSADDPSPLPELPIQYADFALWQRQWLQGEFLAEQSRYWKGVLAGSLPVLELPPARPRPRQRTQRGERRTFTVGTELTAALNGLSRREGVTLYMALLAAFQTLLYRYTGQEDIIVGTAIANRPLDEVGGLIGCFINTLAMRTDFSGTPRFRDVLRRVREMSLGAFAHQDMPFDKLVDELQLERTPGQTPIVQVAFGIQNSPMPALELPGLKLTPVEVDDGVARLDLTLWVEEGADGLKFAWNYSTDLFDAETVARMQGHYETLLRAVAANPETSVDALEMLTDEEKEQAEAQDNKRQESSRRRLLKARPRPVSTTRESAKD
jgi:amino acid adenylation domain-containing protein/non-ribosomal peptide synthase protein (TIGR01720 family)/FkbM family methyltransferase